MLLQAHKMGTSTVHLGMDHRSGAPLMKTLPKLLVSLIFLHPGNYATHFQEIIYIR
jgi:hypothetical protein